MRFIGLDLHKKTLVVCALDRRGKVLFRESVECRREALEAFARGKLHPSVTRWTANRRRAFGSAAVPLVLMASR